MQSGPQIGTGVREGEVLAGKYRIEKILGAGGMGVVVAARHLQLEEKVAIKFLLPEALGNPDAVARFAREARAAVKIKSEHVARVIDVGTLESGAPYMVMEFLEGGDLAAWVQQKGALAVEQAVEFVLQACEAMAEAHGLGIVHRDLKPANLFVIRRADGLYAIKVLDFGISKLGLSGGTSAGFGGTQDLPLNASYAAADGSASGAGMSMTKTATIMGSPFYMSPEQLKSARDVDPRTDIWAIGIILFELLTTRTPFIADSLPELCMHIMTEPLPSLRERRPDAPVGIEKIIAKCLEKERTNRYANVAELAIALGEFGPKRAKASVERIARVISASGLSASALALPPSSDPTSGPEAQGTIAPLGSTAQGTKSGIARGGVFGAVAALILVLVGGVVALRAWSRDQNAGVSTLSDVAPIVAPSGAALGAAPAKAIDEPPVVAVVDAGAALGATTVDATAPPTAGPVAQPTHHAVPGSPPAVVIKHAAGPSSVPTTAAATAATVAKPNPACDPPFTLDDQGQKHFKPECYR